MSRHSRCLALAVVALAAVAQIATAQDPKQQAVAPKVRNGDDGAVLEVYGFGMADFIYDFGQNNPDWFDVNRPSKLPLFDDEFGRDGRTWFSARQSRLGVKGTIPTAKKNRPIKTVFEFDLFGVGVDAGQTTIRPRHMYGEWGKWGAGQTNSVFMDIDIFPNTLEYWGPNGMLFFRNVQVWYHPILKPDGTRATVALERPGASGDAGALSDRIELQNIRARFPAPDVSAEYRQATHWGYVELAGIARWIAWDDILLDPFDLNGDTMGWGVSLSSNIHASKNDVIRVQGIYGAGVENYFNDAPIDVGLERNPGNLLTPVDGEALPNLGAVLYLDHRWNSELTSAIGWSIVNIDNSDLQLASAFHQGQYASTNLLWTPVDNVLMGGEFLWGYRKNNADDFEFSDYRLQFSFKYSFSQKFGGGGQK